MSATDWLDAAQRRCDEASPGPWRKISHWQFGYDEGGQTYSLAGFDDRPDEADEAFMLAARTDLPRALAALRAVEDLMDIWSVVGKLGGTSGERMAAAADTVRVAIAGALRDDS